VSRLELTPDTPGLNFYTLMTAVVVPRPIAWVCTLSDEGTVNLAPHSFYTVACARPPIVMFSSVGSKDTLRNIRATGEFTISLAHAPLLEQVNNSAARFAPDQSEPAQLDIHMESSSHVRPPRVTHSPVAIEATLHSLTELGDSTMILGDVVAVCVEESVMVDGHPDYTRLDPLARLGRDEWALHGEVRSVPRPSRPDDISSR